MLEWLSTPRGRVLPRVTIWFGDLKLPAGATVEAAALEPLAGAAARGERFLDLRADGREVTVVGFDWRDDYEKLEDTLAEVLARLARANAKGSVVRYAEVGSVVRDAKASTWAAERWVKWTLKERVSVDEGGKVGEKKVLAALERVLPEAERWFAVHPDARARLENRGRYGYIDKDGREVVPPTLHGAYELTEGMAVFTDDRGWGLMDASGRALAPRWTHAGYLLRGLAPVRAGSGPRAKHGYVDRHGKMRIAAQFAEAEPFHGPLAQVCVGDWPNLTRRWIDTAGQMVGDPFDYTTGFAEDLAWVYVHSRADPAKPGDGLSSFGCIDARGVPQFEKRFRSAGSFSGGLAAASEIGSTKLGYVDTRGRTVIAERFDEAHPFAEGRAAVKVGGEHRIIDQQGKLLGEPFDGVVGPFSEGFMAVRVRGKVGFVDRDGKMVIKPAFDEAYGFYEGLAYASKKNGWGHIDACGRWVIEPTLEWTNRFADGLAPAKKDGLRGFIDKTGRWVIAPRWKEMQPRFEHGLAWVKLP